LDRLPPDTDLPDWGRIIFFQSPTVVAGNRFLDSVVSSETAEAWAVRVTFPSPPLSRDDAALVRELNVEASVGPALPGDGRPFWIIDWGTWAAAPQRHLLAGIVW